MVGSALFLRHRLFMAVKLKLYVIHTARRQLSKSTSGNKWKGGASKEVPSAQRVKTAKDERSVAQQQDAATITTLGELSARKPNKKTSSRGVIASEQNYRGAGKKAFVNVEFAYHVTNVKADRNQPQWMELQWNPVKNLRHNGAALRHAPCVFFTTTMWRNDIPKRSPFPSSGKKGESYWCVKVPLKHFNCYDHILFINKAHKQVKLFFAREEDVTSIKSDVFNKLKTKGLEYLTRQNNGSGEYTYYSNDYAHPATQYFVNFVVCHSFKLGNGVKWIKMPHAPQKCGHHDNRTEYEFGERTEALRKALLRGFQKRINLYAEECTHF